MQVLFHYQYTAIFVCLKIWINRPWLNFLWRGLLNYLTNLDFNLPLVLWSIQITIALKMDGIGWKEARLTPLDDYVNTSDVCI